MREIVFLKKNEARWKELENALENDTVHPDRLASLFIALTDDLSYARTFYPESKTTQYLNQLSVRMHRIIYRNKPEKSSRVLKFWLYEIPSLIGKNQRLLLMSFLIFVAAFSIGWLSASSDSTYVRLILGDSYVDETISNIQSGKPMDIYGSSSEMPMFWYIVINNVKVSFLCYVLGIFFSVGTAYILFSNGLMVGAFLNLFYQYKVFGTAMLAVWIHGTIEISCILVASTAGFMVGNSLMFPGSWPRLHSLKRGAREGIRIIVGLIPLFFIAALLESFVTRYYDRGLWPGLPVIILSVVFISGYFVVYPLLLSLGITPVYTKKSDHDEF